MADFRRVTDQFSVSPQIGLADVGEAARLGFRTLVNNRPEGEEPGQVSGAEIEAAARAAGLSYVAIPVRGGPTPDQVAQTAALLDRAEAPVLAYCRSGTRSIITWSLAQATTGGHTREELMALGRQAGYDLSSVLGA